MNGGPRIADIACLVERLPEARVLCVGDIMLDRFVSGSVERLSPEAPVPVLCIDAKTRMPGGVGNVARNIAALGAHTNIVSVVGNDPAGQDVAGLVSENGAINVRLIVEDGRETGIKTRFISGTQQLLRTDQESIAAVSGETALNVIAAARQAIPDCAVLVLSDYGKGVLTPAVIGDLIGMAHQASVPVIIDPKGRDYRRYSGADVITPNCKELAEAVGRPVRSEGEIVEAARSLISNHGFGAVLVTRSQDGMTLVCGAGDINHLPAETREVFDVSGAGDTVVAALAAGRAAGASWVNAAMLANIAAGIAVGKVGTATALADDVIQALHHQGQNRSEAKLVNLEQLLDRVSVWRREGKKIGFTNGCFDLLHPGHVSLLSQARTACDRLVVGLNSDSSVRLLKGDHRPIQDESSRSIVLASLGAVDAVILFAEETPIRLIEAVKPDVLVDGADYTLETVAGSGFVLGYGGKVLFATFEDGHSTTRTIARINRHTV